MWWTDAALWGVFLCLAAGCAPSTLNPECLAERLGDGCVESATGSSASLRGISAVSAMTAWASGSGATILRTTSGGESWADVSITHAGAPDFRMIHAFDADTACVLSAGSPARLYRTEDGGASWSLVYEDTRPEIFFDAMRFADSSFGIAFGDSIGGRLQIISTSDGGRTWRRHSPSESPIALPGEAGFAASNSALAISGDSILIGLGGETAQGFARVALSRDRGNTWEVVSTPLKGSASRGIFSIALDPDGRRAVAVGGDYLQPDARIDNILLSADAGRTWTISAGPPPSGYRSAVAFLPCLGDGLFFAVGPGGADLSHDLGRSWVSVNRIAWHAVTITPDGRTLWLSGADGRVGRLDLNEMLSLPRGKP